MTPALISSLGEFLGGAALIVMAALCGAAIFTVLWVRRRWRRLRFVVARRSRTLAVGGAASDRPWLLSCPLPDRRWRSVTRTRRHLWRSVAGAEQAVAAARSADAPLGDLESLVRRLHRAAAAADTSLRIARRDSGPMPASDIAFAQVEELRAAAGHIQHAAVAAHTWITRPATASLVVDAEREAAVVTAVVGGLGNHLGSVASPPSLAHTTSAAGAPAARR